MGLASGERLGPYEILGLVGAGGMGEVYKARDGRLGRTVAIKILPTDLGSDVERRARLEREARAVSSLSHPHVCTLFDIGEYQLAGWPAPSTVPFLVMEFLEGETLAQRLRRRPLSLARSLQIGAEIADGLAAAHSQGFVHRDLKPSNIMLTKSGAKLLDLGLARSLELPDRPSTKPDGPTLTVEGTVVGTWPYMSPEQVEGRSADARSDLWALGTILYEMVTGRPAFEGNTPAILIAAILEREPLPIAVVQPTAPAALDRIVRTCLAKDPEQRFQSAHDVSIELGWLRDVLVGGESGRDRGGARRTWFRLLAAGLVGAVAAAIAMTAVAPRRSPQRPVVRFMVEVPPGRAVRSLALAPEGGALVYVGEEGDERSIYYRRRDTLGDAAVPGTDGGAAPFFSPDGSRVGFFQGERLLRVRTDGRDLSAVCVAAEPRGFGWGGVLNSGAWADDGTIVFTSASGVSRIGVAGQSATPITRLEPGLGEVAHRWPSILPDGRTVLFSVITGMSFDAVPVVATSSATGGRRPILSDGAAARMASPRHLAYVRRGTLMVVGFDPVRLETVGAPVPVIDGVGYEGWRGGAHAGTGPLFTVSPDGDLAYVLAPPPAPTVVGRVSRRGRFEPIAAISMALRPALSLSPDGRRLLLSPVDRREIQVWQVDTRRGALTPLIVGGNAHGGVWSQDGGRFAFSASEGGASNLFVRTAHGNDAAERLTSSPQHEDPGSWSPDGRWLAFAEIDPRTGWNIWVLDVETRAVAPFRRTSAAEKHPAISPDGRWLAYTSDESGHFEVFVERFPTGGERDQVSVGGGAEPVWRPDGRELFYRTDDGLMGVPIEAGEQLVADPPTMVVQGRFLPGTMFGTAAYAVAPDGQSFYVLQASSQPDPPTRIVVVLNWAQELESLVPSTRPRQ